MTREEKLWLLVTFAGAFLGLWMVGNGIWTGYFLGILGGCVFGYNAGKHGGDDNPRREPQPTFRPISWKEEYLRPKEWEAVNDVHRGVIAETMPSAAVTHGAKLMKKELAELKARYPDQNALRSAYNQTP
jgi:hypothetical protein